jgi:hypothetical protein
MTLIQGRLVCALLFVAAFFSVFFSVFDGLIRVGLCVVWALVFIAYG